MTKIVPVTQLRPFNRQQVQFLLVVCNELDKFVNANTEIKVVYNNERFSLSQRGYGKGIFFECESGVGPYVKGPKRLNKNFVATVDPEALKLIGSMLLEFRNKAVQIARGIVDYRKERKFSDETILAYEVLAD